MATLPDLMKQARGKRTRPPHLRPSDGSGACGSCRHFVGNRDGGAGTCALYGGYPVRVDQVSDSFQPRRGG